MHPRTILEMERVGNSERKDRALHHSHTYAIDAPVA